VQTAVIEIIALGFTRLRSEEGHEIIVPNSTMMSSVLVRMSEG
jgi:small-conductance mechanosensitive channel